MKIIKSLLNFDKSKLKIFYLLDNSFLMWFMIY